MASKRRGPYQGTSRTSKWRRKPTDIDITETSVQSNESEEYDIPNEFDLMVEEILEKEKERPEGNGDKSVENEPLYSGSRLSVSMSMLLIVTFVTRHNLSGVALCDLLSLIELHCPPDNICRATLSMYQEFFKELKTPLVFNYFCEKCYYSVPKETESCPNCSASAIKHFISIPLKDQMETILRRPGVLDMIREGKCQRRDQENCTIDDVYDGKVYRDHFDNSGFFHGTLDGDRKNQLHLSLQINTDGVAVFKSSKFGIWPVYAIINELPPDARFTRENRVFLGLWFGTQKPNMKLLFGAFLQEFKLFCTGISMSIRGEEDVLVKAILHSCVADAPARCLMMDFVQFNGKFGCPCCLSPGETFAISATGNSHIYPYQPGSYDGHDKLRTSEETLTTAQKVEVEYLEGRRRDPVPEMGVKGVSFLMTFPKFDLIKGTAIDYMHCILLGVLKMILGLWVDLEHKDQPWSLRSSIDVINERIRRLKPHCLISRLPKKIDEYGDWKASEFRTFLLYYSVPLLEDVLPSIFYKHYSNLVLGTFLLLKNSISQTDLHLAKCCFKQFCIGIEELYGERYATFNVHCLLHLWLKVEELGPLWCQSCFFYEGLNGDLRNLFHGTQQIDLQIVTAICIQNKIPELVDKLENGPVKSFYQRMYSPLQQSIRTCIGKDTFVVGSTRAFVPDENVKDLLQNELGKVAEYYIFYRCFHKKIMLFSEEYKPVKKRNSYTYKSKNSICQIRYFLQCTTENGYQYVAVTRNLHVQSSNVNTCMCHVSIGTTNVMHIQDIEEPVMFIDIEENKKHVAFFPNLIEKD